MGEIFERTVPRQALSWTGERLTTAAAGQVEIEHLHRYFLARELCRGLDVLDVASGEGYGSAFLAQVAQSVTGVELSEDAVRHASTAYVAPNLRYQQGDARNLPLDDASVDVVVSFETIEHFYEQEQFIAETRRVLRPGGRLIISSPEPSVYSPTGSSANPYHVRELSRAEFEDLLKSTFKHLHVLAQRPMLGSALIADDSAGVSNTLTFERRGDNYYEMSSGLVRAPYIIAIASNEEIPQVSNSIFIETSEIGDVLSRASQFGALEQVQRELAAQAQRADALQSELNAQAQRADALQSELNAQSQHAEVLQREAVSRLEQDLAQARTELETIRRQRDLMRMSTLRHAALQREMLKLRRKVDALQKDSEEWKRRYHGLRARLEAILRRFGLLQTARLIPNSVRRFMRERVLGPAKAH